MTRLRAGMLVRIVLRDHALQAESTPPVFTVYGRVASLTKDVVIVDTWHYTDPNVPRDDDVESFTLVRRAIISVEELVPRRGPRKSA